MHARSTQKWAVVYEGGGGGGGEAQVYEYDCDSK